MGTRVRRATNALTMRKQRPNIGIGYGVTVWTGRFDHLPRYANNLVTVSLATATLPCISGPGMAISTLPIGDLEPLLIDWPGTALYFGVLMDVAG